MIRYISILILCLAAILPMEGAKKSRTAKARPAAAAKAKVQKSDDEQLYASISKTNPFEIVPAAGMELLHEDDIETAAMAGDMIAYAKKFIGTRYRRGGKSPKGFDCSGFTSYVFGQFGYNLGASSSDQFNQGEKIAREEISKGDLLFFTGRNARRGTVGHVGIAIDNNPATGEITFIHAATSGGIKIDRISAPYYAARFLGARRVM